MQRAWHEERLACSGISKGLALSGTHLRVSICQWHPSWCPAFLSPSSSLLCHKIPRFPSVHRFTHFTSLVKLLNDIFFFIHIPCEHPLSWGFYFPFVFNLVTYCSCINNHPQWISQLLLKPKTCFSTGLFHLRTWQPWSSSAQAKILSCPESLFLLHWISTVSGKFCLANPQNMARIQPHLPPPIQSNAPPSLAWIIVTGCTLVSLPLSF